MTRSRAVALLALPAALSLAACSSSGTGDSGSVDSASSGSSASSSAGSASSSTSASTSSAGNAAAVSNAQQLAAVLKAGVQTVRTAHLTLSTSVAGQSITGSGDEQLVDSKVQALQLTETLPNGTVRIVYTGGKLYAKLPQTATAAKPYVLVTASSTNPTVRAIAASTASSLRSASVDNAALFVNAASSVKRVGNTSVNGVAATQFAVVVDVAKLPATSASGKQALQSVGVTSIPVQLYLDSQGRPVRVSESFAIKGQRSTTTVDITRYNQPVTISAPPASQVQTN